MAPTVRQRGNNILVYHEIGALILDVIANEGRYGEKAVPNLAKALAGEWTENELWARRAFADAYTKSELEGLLEKRTACGNRLSLTHLQLLAGLPIDQRKKWTREVIAKELTTRELVSELQQHLGKKKTPGRGRPPKPPKSVSSGLTQIQSYRDAVKNRIEMWDKHVFQKILKFSPEDCNEELLEQLDQTIQTEETDIKHAEHIIASAQQAKARVKRVIDSRKQPRRRSTNVFVEDSSSAQSTIPRTPTKKVKIAKKKKSATTKKKVTVPADDRPQPA